MKDQYLPIKKAILAEIKRYDNIIIFRHVNPDGDCIGTSYGLRALLRASFPHKNIYAYGDDVSKYVSFLGNDDVIPEDLDFSETLGIVVDTASEKRISSQLYQRVAKLIKIDHHIAIENYGDLNYVVEESPAASLIIIDWWLTFDKLVLPPEGAAALYTAAVTDTGSFRYDSVTDKTHYLISKLLEIPFDRMEIQRQLDSKSRESVRLNGYISLNFKETPHGVAYFILDAKTKAQFELEEEEFANGVSAMAGIEGIEVWALFIDRGDYMRVRIRSKRVDVATVANQFRGGGHSLAAGATVYDQTEINELVKALDKAVADYEAN